MFQVSNLIGSGVCSKLHKTIARIRPLAEASCELKNFSDSIIDCIHGGNNNMFDDAHVWCKLFKQGNSSLRTLVYMVLL